MSKTSETLQIMTFNCALPRIEIRLGYVTIIIRYRSDRTFIAATHEKTVATTKNETSGGVISWKKPSRWRKYSPS